MDSQQLRSPARYGLTRHRESEIYSLERAHVGEQRLNQLQLPQSSWCLKDTILSEVGKHCISRDEKGLRVAVDLQGAPTF